MKRDIKVLVSGGAGFIGSHIVDKLVTEGFMVKVLDNLSFGKLDNIIHHVKEGSVKFVEADVRDAEVVKECLQEVDYVVHLAALVSVPLSLEKPLLTYEINVKGTLNMLNSSVEADVEKFVYISSCAVYGEPKNLPIDERHPANPISPYAESKLAAENICKTFHEKHGLDLAILRLFNVYGSRQLFNDYSGVITRFIECAKRGSPLIIYGDGEQTRDFVYVGDVADAVLKVLENNSVSGEVFNIGSGKATSINELAKTILDLTGSNSTVVYEGARTGDIRHSCADISNAERTFRYKPKFTLKEGLRKMLSIPLQEA